MPLRIDDRSIPDEEILWRRIVAKPEWFKLDAEGRLRPSSVAFLDGSKEKEVSVHIASLTTQEQALSGRPDDGLAAIRAGLPRALGHAVVRDPTETDPSHALICPPPNKSNSTRKSDARRMAGAAEWVVLPNIDFLLPTSEQEQKP
jgi:hypothetical protein